MASNMSDRPTVDTLAGYPYVRGSWEWAWSQLSKSRDHVLYPIGSTYAFSWRGIVRPGWPQHLRVIRLSEDLRHYSLYSIDTLQIVADLQPYAFRRQEFDGVEADYLAHDWMVGAANGASAHECAREKYLPRKDDPAARDCPYCSASAGSRCRTRAGKLTSRFHADRS